MLLTERRDREPRGAIEIDRVLVRLRIERLQVLRLDHALHQLRADAPAAKLLIDGDMQEQRGVPPDALDAEDADGLAVLLPDIEIPARRGVDRVEEIREPDEIGIVDARGDQ